MEDDLTLEDQVVALETIVQLLMSTLEHHHPGSIRGAIAAIERTTKSLDNVVSISGEEMQMPPAVRAYALQLLKECE